RGHDRVLPGEGRRQDHGAREGQEAAARAERDADRHAGGSAGVGRCEHNRFVGHVQVGAGPGRNPAGHQREPGRRALFEVRDFFTCLAAGKGVRMQGSVSEFLKPRVVKVQPTAPRQARVVIEPFERGFGHTLGNALRRVLLSSMPGAAITEVEIEGVLHEYTSIEGVQEDVVDILLNLKQVALKMHTRDSAELRLSKKGPGPVTAGDTHTDNYIEVGNPELVLATLTKAGELTMTLRVERGRGYRPALNRAAFEEQ